MINGSASYTQQVLISKALMVAGDVTGGECAGIANRSDVHDSIYYFRLTGVNTVAVPQAVVSPGVSFDLASVGASTYVAALIDGIPKMLEINNADGKLANTSNELSAGTPRRIHAITVGGEQSLLMVVTILERV